MHSQKPPMQPQGPPQQMQGLSMQSQGPPRPGQGIPGQTQGPPRQDQGPPRQAPGSPMLAQRALGQPQGPPRPPSGAPGQVPPRQPQGLSAQTQGLSAQTQGPPRPTQGPPAAQSQGPLRQMQGSPPQTQGPSKSVQGPLAQTQGPPRLTQGPPTQTQGPPRQTQGLPPQNQGPPRPSLDPRPGPALGQGPLRQATIPKRKAEDSVKKENKPIKQVEVECVAPYDEADWVSLGRVADGARPDEVQYASMLSPPHHLTSLFRLAPAAQKGLAATERNTLVFMVLEGEITVVLNTSQFVVSRGDSFFVPPHNSYNLLNMSGTKAELFLVQYRHQGELQGS